MTTEPMPRTTAPAPITDRTLIRFGAALTIAAGALRIPTSFIDPDSTGAAIHTLYYAIDISLLLAVITSYVAIPASRTRLGSLGFAIAAVGAGLLIGPEPPDASIDYYVVGATAVTTGFGALAIAWKPSPWVTSTTRIAFLATLAFGIASGLHQAIFVLAGLSFSWGLLQLGRNLLLAAETRGEHMRHPEPLRPQIGGHHTRRWS